MAVDTDRAAGTGVRARVTRLILFRGGFDPWHPPDETGFSKWGYVTATEMVIHPRRSRIARAPLNQIVKRPHRFMILNHPQSSQIEEFFTSNVINNKLYVRALLEMGNANSTFWNNPIKLPVLTPITPEEHEARWNRMVGLLQKGDGIFTFDTSSCISRVITHLDQGTWSHVATHSGDGQICEAITAGVVERSIEAYHDCRYRLGVYRPLRASPEHIDAMIAALRSQLGKRYNYRGVLRLGMKLALGIWPQDRRDATPNIHIAMFEYDLVALV
jgi:hypothetical protein